MGVYIKGIEMPKCGRITIQIGADGAVYLVTDGKITAEIYMECNPAITVPPHGRLGDLDSLALLVLNWISTQEKAYPHEDSNSLAWRLGAKAMANQIYRDVKAYPTIIPASEESETCAICAAIAKIRIPLYAFIACFAKTMSQKKRRIKMTDRTELAKLFPPMKRKPITNGDRVRGMTDEELAKWLWFKVGKCPPFDACPSQCIPCEAKDCWLDWLKQEATDGE